MNSVITEKLAAFFGEFKEQKYRKGEILVRADENPRGIFYLTEGIVKEYAISKKGDEVVVNIFKPISFFPMSWAINNTENRYYFEAVNDVCLRLAPKEKVVAFVKAEPDVLFDLLSRLYRGVDGMLTRMTYLMGGNAKSRLITELIIAAKRFGKKDPTGKQIELWISEKDFAAQSGMTRETVSRGIKVLKDKGFITFNKH